ncbi:MAG TPA: cysteine desulfurase NifS [Clostridiales bacterium]|nr:cysteine desulfurase NifS [Clostridiales bacterium]
MIYLDNAATSRPDAECFEAAKKYILTDYYNPSALYAGGYNLHLELKKAGRNILSLIADDENYSIIFTSCGTEADNQAIFCGGRRGNVVTTKGEHSAVFASATELGRRGIEVRFAELNPDGSVDVDALLKLVDEKTSLVSVIHVNNETGAINNIAKISEKVKSKNPRTLFHSDGVQAFGKLNFRLTENIDMYSVSAHKIGGIKGCGALIKRKKLIINPYIYGGGQEQNLRSGTENVFGIKFFELAALKRFKNLDKHYAQVNNLNSIMREKLDKRLFKIISSVNTSPYILTVAAYGVRGETILHEADDLGLIIGTGSACSSNEKKRYSRVILACGISEDMADGILRISFSPENSVEEIERAAEILNNIVENRREKMA